MSNKKLLALAAVVAASAASAQTAPTTPPTHAGTLIKNVATLTYTDPNTNQPVPPINSNEVVTKVAAVPNFTITPNQTDPTETGVADQDKPGQENNNVLPGATVEFKYTVTNTGNTPIVVELETKGDKPDVQRTDNKVVGDVEYYYKGVKLVDTDGDGKVELPEKLPVGEAVEITQRYKLPDNAAGGKQYGANPVGTATYNKAKPEANNTVAPNGDDVLIPGQTAPLIDKNNFNRVTVAQTGITNTPPTNPGNPERPGDPITDPSKPPVKPDPLPSNPTTDPTPGQVTPPPPPGNPGKDPAPDPQTGTPEKPVQPNNPPGKDNSPTTPGYKDPKPNDPATPTPIETSPTTNDQKAYPPADKNTTPDKVTFVNEVTNTGKVADKITIGAPTFSDPNAPAVVKEPKRADGTPIVDEDTTKEGIQVTLQPGERITYHTEVTYPDKDDSTTKRDPIVVKVPVTSEFAPDKPVETTDTVYPPATLFGDTKDANGQPNVTGLNVTPTPAPVETVNPKGDRNNQDPINSPANDDAIARFPMTVTNPGAYNDTYILDGTVTFQDDKGQDIVVPVKYYDKAGKELPKVPGTDKYITPVVPAGELLDVFAVVVVPENTAPKEYTVTQKLKANYSGIELTDTNDLIRVQATGEVKFAKFQKSTDGHTGPAQNEIKSPTGFTPAQQEYAPGANHKYRILAKNNYNYAVTNITICDATPAGAQFTNVAALNYTGNTVAHQNGNVLAGYANNTGVIDPVQSEGKTYCVIFPTVDAGATVEVEFDAIVK